MSRQSRTADMFVLDAVMDDIEDLDGIMRNLNRSTSSWRGIWGREFRREEVVQALIQLIARDFIRAYVLDGGADALKALPRGIQPPGTLDHSWFGPTARGRFAHRNWEPLEEDGSEDTEPEDAEP